MMLKSKLKNFYYSAASLFGLDKRRLQKLRADNKIAVLNLHRISPEKNPFWSPLHPQIFEELLKFLNKNFEVCLFREIREKQDSEKPLAIISFDDGYRDFVEYAVPLLERYDVKANMNIIPACAESGEAMWNIKLYDFLNSAPVELINEIKLPGFDGKIETDTEEDKLKYGLRISRFLKLRPRSEREKILELLEPFYEKIEFRKTEMMNAQEIKKIAATHEVGVHSYTHESMAFEKSEFFENDFFRCKNYFAEKLSLPLEIYAFPNGSYRNEQIDFLQKENINHILLVDEKFADASSNIFPRITTYGKNGLEVRMKALGF